MFISHNTTIRRVLLNTKKCSIEKSQKIKIKNNKLNSLNTTLFNMDRIRICKHAILSASLLCNYF